MSVRYGLLALLHERAMYGNQLRAEFEAQTAGTWPLNVGQVYTTLDRLTRDGLVATHGPDSDGHERYELTEAGRAELTRWWSTPVARESRPRDELTIKLAFAVAAADVNVRDVVQTQRADTMRALQQYMRMKNAAVESSAERNIAWLLVLESLIFQAEAEIRWLDHCEHQLVMARNDTKRGRR